MAENHFRPFHKYYAEVYFLSSIFSLRRSNHSLTLVGLMLVLVGYPAVCSSESAAHRDADLGKCHRLFKPSESCSAPKRGRENCQQTVTLLCEWNPRWQIQTEIYNDTFLNRGHDELQTHWSKPLDTQRGRALNPTNVKLWFDLLKENIEIKIYFRIIFMEWTKWFPPSDQVLRGYWQRAQKHSTNKVALSEKMSQLLSLSVQMELFLNQPLYSKVKLHAEME